MKLSESNGVLSKIPPNKSFQRTVKKLRFLPSAEFKRYASVSLGDAASILEPLHGNSR